MVTRAALALAFTAAALAAATPTFHRDVEPILQAHCQSCHRPGEIGPFPLIAYAQVRPQARAIRAAVLQKKMPPWFAAEASHPFSNDLSLTSAQIETHKHWADNGAPRGNPDDAPPARPFTEGWNISPPDAVFSMASEFDIPAEATIDYMHIVVPTGFTEDK
ncbi:MAG TPA: thiol-disulfide isomerase, partial [bacterium]|nr:thiol-disulfide isomerase [bacterium]